MYKFQKPTTRSALPEMKKNSLPRTLSIKDAAPQDFDEVDRVTVTPSQSIFDPNSTSTSIYDYEDDFEDNPGAAGSAEDYCSLPVQVAHLNNLDSVYFSSATQQHWEAEDVGDFITTLDESCSSIDDVMYSTPKKVRPKSLYNPGVDMFGGDPKELLANSAGPPVEKWAKIMTTSCYGALTPENLNRIGSEHHLDLSSDLLPSTLLAQLDGNQRLWMASTEELMKVNQDIENMIQQRVVADIHQRAGMDLNTSATDDNLLSLENSYCEPQNSARSLDLAERAESGESMGALRI